MATEKRLIDANKIKYHTVGAGGWGIPEEVACKSQIDRIPTVDAVEVVPCAQCQWYDEDGEFCQFWQGVRHPEHYCGEGERKTDD